MSKLYEEDLTQILKQAIAQHPADDELGLLHDGVADGVTSARIKAHLRQCPACQEKFAMMQHVLATYHEVEVSPAEVAQLKALIAKTPSPYQRAQPQPQALAVALKAIVGMALFALDAQRKRQKIHFGLQWSSASAAPAKMEFDGQTEDGALGWHIEEDDHSDDLLIDFDSTRLELENYTLTVTIGALRKSKRLERVDKNQVGAKLVITRDERTQLQDNDDLVIESLTPPE